MPAKIRVNKSHVSKLETLTPELKKELAPKLLSVEYLARSSVSVGALLEAECQTSGNQCWDLIMVNPMPLRLCALRNKTRANLLIKG